MHGTVRDDPCHLVWQVTKIPWLDSTQIISARPLPARPAGESDSAAGDVVAWIKQKKTSDRKIKGQKNGFPACIRHSAWSDRQASFCPFIFLSISFVALRAARADQLVCGSDVQIVEDSSFCPRFFCLPVVDPGKVLSPRMAERSRG